MLAAYFHQVEMANERAVKTNGNDSKNIMLKINIHLLLTISCQFHVIDNFMHFASESI